MARSSWLMIMASLILVTINVIAAASSPVTYVVGDALGWTVPAIVGANPKAYEIWAAKNSFKVGDKLVFNYVFGSHNMVQVNKASCTSCDTTNTTKLALYSSPPTSITLNSPGEYFFICTYPGHCDNGQKLAIDVVDVVPLETTSLLEEEFLPLILPGFPFFEDSAEISASSLGAAGISTTLLSVIVDLFLG